MSKSAKIARALKREDRDAPPPELRLSSGSTLINLACSDDATYAYTTGHSFMYVGDSSSGKSFINMTTLAEAAINPAFDDYRLIYDDVENGVLMDVESFFGPKLAARIEMNTKIQLLEDWYGKVDADLKSDRPFIRVLDSMDALRPLAADQRFAETSEAISKGKEAGGSYGTEKARINSQNLPRINSELRRTNSILFLISQSRQNIGFGSQFQPKTRSGGTAMKFFTTNEVWTSVKETIKKTVRDKERVVGSLIKFGAKKNRQSGRIVEVCVPILHGCGLDDIGSVVRWLVEENFWSEDRKVISAPQFDFKGKMDSLIGKIEGEGRQEELRALSQGLWDEIEEGCRASRRPRYTSGD